MERSALDQPYRGGFVGKQHRFALTVYFEDTDFSGLVYHGSYVRWCERGRSDFLRLAGVHHSLDSIALHRPMLAGYPAH